MTDRVDALALAVVLSAKEETVLAVTDSALAAKALFFYAENGNRSRVSKALTAPLMGLAALIAVMALTGSAEPVVTAAIGNAAVTGLSAHVVEFDFRNLPVEHFEKSVRQHVRPVAHSSQLELDAASFTTANVPGTDG